MVKKHRISLLAIAVLVIATDTALWAKLYGALARQISGFVEK
jgi:hypothetical protein